VHYEQKRTDGGVPLDLSVSGAPGYTVYFDGRLDTPVKDGDRILVNGLTLVVETVNEIGNLTPSRPWIAWWRHEPGPQLRRVLRCRCQRGPEVRLRAEGLAGARHHQQRTARRGPAIRIHRPRQSQRPDQSAHGQADRNLDGAYQLEQQRDHHDGHLAGQEPARLRLPLRRQLWPWPGRCQSGRRPALRGWRHSPVPQIGRPGQSAALR
jgi:hypothetical protein